MSTLAAPGATPPANLAEPDPSAGSESLAQPAVVAKMPRFPELGGRTEYAEASSLDSLLDINVTITVELGRVTLPIGDVLKLGVGSVLPLDRNVSDPVDLVVQGVRFARGEVVVVEDHFAIRIKEIMEPKKRQ